MKIENIVRITGGVLLNTPSVDAIDEIKIDAKKVLRGNLFIDINNSVEDLNEAIKNGAYCILTSSIPKISDEEIAWICVNDLDKTLIKLSRFFATNKNFKFVPLSKIQYELAKCLQLEKKAQTLSQEEAIALLQILSAKEETIFFVVDNKFITMVDPTLTKPKEELEADDIFERSIFYSSFALKDFYMKDIRLSSLFIPYLCSLLDYLNSEKIEYKIESFNHFEHFYPQFVNKKLEKKDFGSTSKALIFEDNFELFLKEIEYIEEKIDINSLIVFAPNKIINEFTCKAKKMAYKNFSDVKNLQNLEFKYALVYGKLYNFEASLQVNSNIQMTLF